MRRILITLVLLCGLPWAAFAGTSAYKRGDYETAFRQFMILAREGNSNAQTYLGVMYSNGQGVAVDYAKAVKWYRRAAAQGNASAQYNLAVMYAKGQGVKKSKLLAHMFFDLSAATGDPHAKNGRQMIARSLSPAAVAKAKRMARDWRRKHADPTPKKAGDDGRKLVSLVTNRHLYAGNTALGVSTSGRKFRVYFGRNGSVEYRDERGNRQQGTWNLTDGGLLCYNWATWPHRCYTHYLEGDEYQSYRDGVKKGSRFVIKRGKIGFGG